MKKWTLKILVGLIFFGSSVMATEEWVLSQPQQTDTTNYEWVLGQPFIYVEEVAAAAGGEQVIMISRK